MRPTPVAVDDRGARGTRVLLGWNLAGRRVLVVGGGRVAEAKVEVLADSGARIVVVAPTLTDRLLDLHATGLLTWRRRRVRVADACGCALVVAAVDDRRVNRRVRRWAHLFRAVVNVVDDPANCDVIVPAVVRRGPVRLAVSTDGASPAAARFLREELDRLLPVDLGALVGHAAAARRELRSSGRYRYDYPTWRRRFFEPGWDDLWTGRSDALLSLRRQFVDAFDRPAPSRCGRVIVMAVGPDGTGGLGGEDRVAASLRGAEVVFYDPTGATLAALAPVAAERVPLSGLGAAEVVTLLRRRAEAGAVVAVLVAGPAGRCAPGEDLVGTLQAAGVDVTVLAGRDHEPSAAAST